MRLSADPLVSLYQTLPIEQCVELYKKQHDNIPLVQRRAVLSVIGAKFVYGADYTPGHKYGDSESTKPDTPEKASCEATDG